MSSLKDIMSIIDPSAKSTASAPKQAALGVTPKPAPRPVGGANGATQAPQLKRKASSPAENGQAKMQRKEAVGGPAQANGAVRATSKPASSAPTTSVPYRGTAAPASSKAANPPVRKPLQSSSAPAAAPKAPAPAPKAAPAATGSAAAASSAAPKKGYLAMLQKAKEKDASKPVAPPIKHEPTKILTRKERLALKAEAGVKGKKPVAGLPSKPVDPKVDPSKEKKKVDVGYQGTARPAKKPVEVGYKGTARPTSVPATSSRNGVPAAKPKPNPTKGRYDGYADWDDLDAMEDEEDDYESDASSDMEGGIWDVEEEEQLALKAAKKEDAEALAEENRLKREKEERKKKLAAMAAKAKKRY
ncbi:hypothetical protein ACJQWK_05606 [Exserohilum turcicum]|uniref:SPT2 chromatin protein n=1 Tax=Exserohilum turcicum (strain 28A) TaxID=671987 RepID=R0IN10_EXST2|nr:uncharacterized protein SETTUDRAFT_169176 [Exserohilum turcica Et28A]EOA86415.1 hypothetical protein SETTUDRAFT_169176 [Exserohilum turcica Et28A]